MAKTELITEASITAVAEVLSQKVDYVLLEVSLQVPLAADLMKTQKE